MNLDKLTAEDMWEDASEEDKRLAADFLGRKGQWCASCEEWVPADEMRDDPWGGGRLCTNWLADEGIEDQEMKEQ